MDCEYSKYINDLLEGRIKEKKEIELLEHAKHCNQCAQKLKEIKDLDVMMAKALENYSFVSSKEKILSRVKEKRRAAKVISKLYNFRKLVYSICIVFAFVFSFQLLKPILKELPIFTLRQGVNSTIPAGEKSTVNSIKAVYFADKKDGRLQEDITKYPEVIKVNTFEELRKVVGENPDIDIWIDKNAADLLEVGWLSEAPQKYNLLVMIGCDNALYSFREILNLGIEGPSINWNETKVGDGFSVWKLVEDNSDGSKQLCEGYSKMPTVEGIFEITEILSKESNETDNNIESKSTLRNVIVSETEYDIDKDGNKEAIQIVLVEGNYNEDNELWAGSGPKWTGAFAVKVLKAESVLFSESLNKLLYPNGGEEVFLYAPEFQLELNDYNNDGLIDFNIGQYFSSNGFIYKFFTINEEGVVSEILFENRSFVFVSSRGNSIDLEFDNGEIKVPYYDNSKGKHFTDYYKWDTDNKVFKLISSQES